MCLISSRVAESGEEGASAGMQQEGSAGDGGGLARGCRILVIDSLHLVVETLPFLEELQARYALSRAKEPYKRALLNPLQKSPTNTRGGCCRRATPRLPSWSCGPMGAPAGRRWCSALGRLFSTRRLAATVRCAKTKIALHHT